MQDIPLSQVLPLPLLARLIRHRILRCPHCGSVRNIDAILCLFHLHTPTSFTISSLLFPEDIALYDHRNVSDIFWNIPNLFISGPGM